MADSDLYSCVFQTFSLKESYACYKEFVESGRIDDVSVEKVVRSILPFVKVVLQRGVLGKIPNNYELEDFASVCVDKIWYIVKNKIIYHDYRSAFWKSTYTILRNHIISNIKKVKDSKGPLDGDYMLFYPQGIKSYENDLDYKELLQDLPSVLWDFIAEKNRCTNLDESEILFIIEGFLSNKTVKTISLQRRNLLASRFYINYIRFLCKWCLWEVKEKYGMPEGNRYLSDQIQQCGYVFEDLDNE